MTTPKRRPRRSNSALSIVRGIAGQKTIYWTTSRLRKLLRGVFSTARQEHFAKAVKALKAWPERTKEQNIDDASHINPRKRMDGGHYWPTSMLTLMEEYADRAAQAPRRGRRQPRNPKTFTDPPTDRTIISRLERSI